MSGYLGILIGLGSYLSTQVDSDLSRWETARVWLGRRSGYYTIDIHFRCARSSFGTWKNLQLLSSVALGKEKVSVGMRTVGVGGWVSYGVWSTRCLERGVCVHMCEIKQIGSEPKFEYDTLNPASCFFLGAAGRSDIVINILLGKCSLLVYTSCRAFVALSFS